MKINRTCRSLLGLALAGLLASATALKADSRDDKIEDAFKNTYVYKTQLRNSDISINAKNGVATLKGTAENEDQCRLAEDTARGLPGVERVDNQLRVTNEPKESSDEWISLKVRGALLFHRNVSASDTKVTVRDGVVTLTGTAASDAEKELASEYAKDVKGVQRVDNQLRVVPAADRRVESDRSASRTTGDMDRRTAGDRIDDASITAQVKSALAIHKSTSALHTGVTTTDGIVTITGDAKNGAEKDLVTKLAENVNGVRSVRNEMSVQER